MGMAAIVFAFALWNLYEWNREMADIRNKLNLNQRNAEVIRIG